MKFDGFGRWFSPAQEQAAARAATRPPVPDVPAATRAAAPDVTAPRACRFCSASLPTRTKTTMCDPCRGRLADYRRKSAGERFALRRALLPGARTCAALSLEAGAVANRADPIEALNGAEATHDEHAR